MDHYSKLPESNDILSFQYNKKSGGDEVLVDRKKSSSNQRNSCPFGDLSSPFASLTANLPGTTAEDIEKAEQLLAREFSALSMTEREQVTNELHGVVPSVEGAEALLAQQKKIRSLRRILSEEKKLELPGGECSLQIALKMNEEYVLKDCFLIKFLRTHGWDVHQTAKRIKAHFEIKRELFGDELLCRDITQDDLDAESLNLLYSNWAQDLPLPDMAGRLVSFLVPNERKIPVKSKLRRTFYATMVKSEEEDIQTKGRVGIIWMENKSKTTLDHATTIGICKMFSALPAKFCALHVCVVGKKATFLHNAILAAAVFAMESLLRIRLKIHYGNHQELKHILTTFGIPEQVLPITPEGVVLMDHASVAWSQRRLVERQRAPSRRVVSERLLESSVDITVDVDTGKSDSSTNNSDLSQSDDESLGNEFNSPGCALSRVVTPGSKDVLLGRGRLSRDHLGNVEFRDIIDQRRQVYENASKREKTIMASDLVNYVKSHGGRFLKEEGSGWVEVEDKVARSKVANCFRTFRHRTRRELDT